jgi:hypothetical protein
MVLQVAFLSVHTERAWHDRMRMKNSAYQLLLLFFGVQRV